MYAFTIKAVVVVLFILIICSPEDFGGQLAQSVEHWSAEIVVLGSNPAEGRYRSF